MTPVILGWVIVGCVAASGIAMIWLDRENK
jgi:hypothetical protein